MREKDGKKALWKREGSRSEGRREADTGGQEDPEDSALLKLDLSVLHENGDVYSSLTDENQLALFTDRYEEGIRQSETAAAVEEEALWENLFTASFPAAEDRDQELMGKLFTQTADELRRQTYDGQQGETYGSVFGIIPACLLFLLLLWMSGQHRKRRRRHAADIDHS